MPAGASLRPPNATLTGGAIRWTQAGYVGSSKPPLRCSGKGANRTPPECIVPGLPQAGGERSFRRRKPALQLAGREPDAGGLQRGRAIGKTNEVGSVTANAMAELTHRDFLPKLLSKTRLQARP